MVTTRGSGNWNTDIDPDKSRKNCLTMQKNDPSFRTTAFLTKLQFDFFPILWKLWEILWESDRCHKIEKGVKPFSPRFYVFYPAVFNW